MGTSISSQGPGGGVALIPPWANDPDEDLVDDEATEQAPADDGATEEVPGEANDDPQPQTVDPDVATAPVEPVAPPGRFGPARTNLGNFARTGSVASLGRGLRSYVRRGIGGSGNGAARMAPTARRANRLFNLLVTLSNNTATQAQLGVDPEELAGRSAREVADFIVELLSPSDGPLSTEHSQESISLALSELLRTDPNIDLTALTVEQIWLILEAFISHDIYHMVNLDIGTIILQKAPDIPTAMDRLGQMQNYIRQSVASEFRRHNVVENYFTSTIITTLMQTIIRQTFQVFEEYTT